MGSSSAITVGFFLFLISQLSCQIRANPVYTSVSNSDLMDFKNLLDRLEDKMPLEEEVVPPQVLSEQNDEAEVALGPLPEVSPWTREVDQAQRDAGALGRGPWDSSERSALLKNKLRALLAAPRSLRRSSCFGGRMDRIGAQSSLGCNSFRELGRRRVSTTPALKAALLSAREALAARSFASEICLNCNTLTWRYRKGSSQVQVP
ncbi:natriuretic peptides A [Rhynchocyon petersi]